MNSKQPKFQQAPICKYIKEGKHCKFGKKCYFSHDVPTQAGQNQKNSLFSELMNFSQNSNLAQNMPSKPEIDDSFIQTKIEEFFNDDSAQTLEFPSSLNSYHRSLAHRLAEERNLIHESHGEGYDRKLLIQKKDKNQMGREGLSNQPQENWRKSNGPPKQYQANAFQTFKRGPNEGNSNQIRESIGMPKAEQVKKILNNNENGPPAFRKSKPPKVDLGKVKGIIRSFMRNGTFDKDKYYTKIVEEGFNQSDDDLDLKRVLLKLIKAAIDNCCGTDRDILDKALKHSFIQLSSFSNYRVFVLQSKGYGFNPDQLSQIIYDLDCWVLASEKTLRYYRSRYAKIPADELLSFINCFTKDVQDLAQYSFSENDKQIAVNHEALKVRADNLCKFKNDLHKELGYPIIQAPRQGQNNEEFKGEQEPTDDFRSLKINPTLHELSLYRKPVLREIRKDRGFDSLNHYLDVNFRLLKEDFTSELRDGLQQYQDNPDQRNQQVSVYSDAKISGFFVTRNFFGLKLCINLKNRFFQFQRKFMHGGLLMFSNDGFKQRIVQCIVRDKDEKQMFLSLRKHGYILIDVEIITDELNDFDAFSTFRSMFGTPMVILESKSYYEAYYHILKQLQQIDSIPFEKQIVHADPHHNQVPQYLQEIEYLDEIVDYHVKKFTLDSYQEQAFRNAFNSQISLIQGPPGTGKTYIGEKIAQMMLEILKKREDPNLRQVKGLSTGPILLTCFTNHALDQFLEKISGYTDSIVRLGGRTKMESMNKFTLREVQKTSELKMGKAHWELRKDQESLVKNCAEKTSYYEHFIQVGTLNEGTFEIFNEELSQSFSSIAVEVITDYLDDKTQVFENFEISFLMDKEPAFREYYNQNVTQQIPDRAIFEWLGILDLDFVYEKFLGAEKAKRNQNQEERKHEEERRQDDEAYLQEELENDRYKLENEVLNELRKASDKKFFIQNLMQVEPFFYQDRAQVFTNYGSLINHRKKNLPENIIGTDEAKDFIQEILSLDNNGHPSPQEKRSQFDQRWMLNNLVVKQCEYILQRKIENTTQEIQENKPMLERYELDLNKKILQSSDVVAMTTTGAAKYKNLLSQVSSKIMIVEEAAQILEAHMATSLTKDIEHLILIGDHEQLRPNLNVLRLSTLYNLDISMFERFINNKFQNVMLMSQRRMRPEISEIVRCIYPNLIDDESVKIPQEIRGINGQNYIFFHHKFQEQKLQNVQSKTNPKEAEIIIKFANYIIQQGQFKPEEITILSLYAGQLLTIKNIVTKNYPEKDANIRGVKIRTVDDYQGEENEIVILSLVRSNHHDQIGFLKASNRVCVALSRARKGMFIFGNAECLRNASLKIDQKDKEAHRQKHIWLQVLEILVKRGNMKEKLELKCKNHDNVTCVKTAEDFDQVPEGGCQAICKVRMECGHACESFCHVFDITEDNLTGHDHIKCHKDCVRPRTNCNHPCTYKCYQCKDKEQPCLQKVSLTLDCGHANTYLCHQLDENIECEKQCRKILACGHKCKRLCKIDCEHIYPSDVKKGYQTSCKEPVLKKMPCGHEQEIDCGLPAIIYYNKEGCQKLVTKTLPCGHDKDIKCGLSPDEYFFKYGCKEPCNAILECDPTHVCPNNCGQCFDQIFHGDCNQKCGRIKFCHHECQDTCDKNCPPCDRPCTQKCSHSICTRKCGEICFKCVEPCQIQCEHSKCTKLCHEICDRKPCTKPCLKKLECGHDCIGFCGEICPKVCRVKGCEFYKEEVFQLLFGEEDDPDARFIELEDCGCVIETIALGNWLQTKLDAENEINHQKCPKCPTIIRNCQRFQDKVKSMTAKINRVKEKQFSELKKLSEEKVCAPQVIEAINKRMASITNNEANKPYLSNKVKGFFVKMKNVCKDHSKYPGNKHGKEISTYSSKLNFIDQFLIQIEDHQQKEVDMEHLFEVIEKLEPVFTQILKPVLHPNRIRAIEQIQEVFGCYIQIRAGHEASRAFNISEFPQSLIKAQNSLLSKRFHIEQKEFDQLKKYMLVFRDTINHTGRAFRKMIMKELNLGAGHWFECPNGHIYAIGECGGATEESKCPECKAKIGGTSHKLLDSNNQSKLMGNDKMAYGNQVFNWEEWQ